MDSVADVWESVLDYIKKQYVDNGKISQVAFNTWIRGLSLQNLTENDVVVLSAKREFHIRMSSKYAPYIREGFESVLGFPVVIKMIAEIEEEEPLPPEQSYELRKLYAEDENETPRPKVKVSSDIDDEYSGHYTFSNFIVGSSNKFAHAAAMAVAQNPAGPYNPLFIYGPPGLGKTHLLNAIKNEIQSNRPAANIVMIKGVDFANGIVESIRNGTINDYHRAFAKADVLLMDDVQFIAGKERTQEEFFHNFNRLFEANKQIVLTSDRPPKEIHPLDERLRGRFEMGLLADIGYPDFETRMAIIARKAESLDLELPKELCEFIANRLKSNIRQLEGTVKKLKIYSQLDETAVINISLAQVAVSDTLSEDAPSLNTVDKIFDEVCRMFDVTEQDIKSKKRVMPISQARMVAMYIIRSVMGMSLPEIGKLFNRDHSTVIYSINEVTKDMNENSFFKSSIEDIIKNIKNN